MAVLSGGGGGAGTSAAKDGHTAPVRYSNLVADNIRWDGFELRAGDVIISTPAKCGTTLTQMICALLIFDGPDFPAALDVVSPWLDMQTRAVAEVHRMYASQRHRRFIKTHTPLDGLPMRDDVTYVVVGRDPRDVAVSWDHHMANIDLDRVLELRAAAVGNDDLADLLPTTAPSDDPAERFRAFVTETRAGLAMTLETVLQHLESGWRLRNSANVVLMHYSDYRTDLAGELAHLGAALGFDISRERAEELAACATLDRMRERAEDVVPLAPLHMWRSTAGFLRAGSSGEWRALVTDDDLALYERRVDALVEPGLKAWVHGGRSALATT